MRIFNRGYLKWKTLPSTHSPCWSRRWKNSRISLQYVVKVRIVQTNRISTYRLFNKFYEYKFFNILFFQNFISTKTVKLRELFLFLCVGGGGGGVRNYRKTDFGQITFWVPRDKYETSRQFENTYRHFFCNFKHHKFENLISTFINIRFRYNEIRKVPRYTLKDLILFSGFFFVFTSRLEPLPPDGVPCWGRDSGHRVVEVQ